nr:hypothetical protein [Tanacetum cinerariifolium]
MDVKSAFLYGTIDKEVYVTQPPGFVDHKTLFIKKDKNDIMLVQVYVDDIIFRSTKKSLCDEFEALMHKRFQMSSMRELTFFLGLQVKQSEEGIFISQDKYVAEILKKFIFFVKIASTPIETQKPLVKDEDAADVDVSLYRFMIGSLVYLTASRPDIMFAVCACSRDSPFDLEAYSDSNYAGANHDRRFIFDGMWRNLDGSKKKFLMYSRFLQIFLKNQIPDLVEPLNDVYVTPTLSRTVTPLFAAMLAQPVVVEGEGSGNPPESQPIPFLAQPINESQILESSPSPKNTQSPMQTLEGTGFPHTMGPNFLDPRVDVEGIHKEGVTVWCGLLLLLD